jgi:hypothetical protein
MPTSVQEIGLPARQVVTTVTSKIGDMRGDTEMGGLVVDPEDGTSWARTGTLFPAAAYPKAAKNPRTMVNGIAITLPTLVNITGIADNGAGTIVAAFGSNLVMYSTDNGVTWNTVSGGNANLVTDVAWCAAAGRFINVGNSATDVTVSWSATGVTGWTTGVAFTASLSTGTAGTARIKSDGSTCVIAAKHNGSFLFTTVNGASGFTRTTASAFAGGQPYITVLPSLGATRWLVVQNNGNGGFQSVAADGSGTWASMNISAIGNICGLASGNGIFVAFADSQSSYATSINGTTWTTRGLPFANPGNALADGLLPYTGGGGSWVKFDGFRFVTDCGATQATAVAQGLFAYSTDGINWTSRQLTVGATGAINNKFGVYSTGSNLFAYYNGGGAGLTTAQYSFNWATSCDYVGKARNGLVNYLSGNVMQSSYVRIN